MIGLRGEQQGEIEGLDLKQYCEKGSHGNQHLLSHLMETAPAVAIFVDVLITHAPMHVWAHSAATILSVSSGR